MQKVEEVFSYRWTVRAWIQMSSYTGPV